GGTGRPEERIRHVARDLEIDVREPPIQAAEVEAGDVVARPECLQDPEAAVRGRAAADPEDDPLDAGIERSFEELARAAGRRPDGIVRPWLDTRQAGRLCQLDEGATAVLRAQPPGVDVGSERPR